MFQTPWQLARLFSAAITKLGIFCPPNLPRQPKLKEALNLYKPQGARLLSQPHTNTSPPLSSPVAEPLQMPYLSAANSSWMLAPARLWPRIVNSWSMQGSFMSTSSPCLRISALLGPSRAAGTLRLHGPYMTTLYDSPRRMHASTSLPNSPERRPTSRAGLTGLALKRLLMCMISTEKEINVVNQRA